MSRYVTCFALLCLTAGDENLKDPGGPELTKPTKPPGGGSFVSFVSTVPLEHSKNRTPQSGPHCGRDLRVSQWGIATGEHAKDAN